MGEPIDDWKEHRTSVYVRLSHGASPETLVRRLAYGGRKARSAKRRLGRLPLITLAFAIRTYAESLPCMSVETKGETDER